MTDIQSLVECQLEVWRATYMHQLPPERLLSPTLLPQFIERRTNMMKQGGACFWVVEEKQKEQRDMGNSVINDSTTMNTNSSNDSNLNINNSSNSDKSRIVGFCDAGPVRTYPTISFFATMTEEERNSTLELWTLYLHPSMHRTGISSALFACAVTDAVHKWPECGERMLVITLETNTGGRKFYERMGGKLVGILPGYELWEASYAVACFEWHGVSSWLLKWAEQQREK